MTTDDEVTVLTARITAIEHAIYGVGGEQGSGGMIAEMQGLRADLRAFETTLTDLARSVQTAALDGQKDAAARWQRIALAVGALVVTPWVTLAAYLLTKGG